MFIIFWWCFMFSGIRIEHWWDPTIPVRWRLWLWQCCAHTKVYHGRNKQIAPCINLEH